MNAFCFGELSGHGAPQTAEDMHQMLSKGDLVALGDYSDASEYNNKNPRLYKVNHFVLPIFFLEIVAVGCVGALAYYLRFTDVFPLQEYPLNCSDPGISYPYLNASTSLLTNVPVEIVYSVTLLLPLVVMLIGELGYWLFSSNPKKVVRAHCIGLKLHLMPRRFFRYAGLFLLGLFSTSIFTDLAKLITARPRPYFRWVCEASCHNADGSLTITDQDWCVDEDLRTAHASFPSFHASITLYSAVFVSIYMHNLLTARGARLLRPLLVFAVIGLAVLAGLSRFLTYRSHWQDVLAGFLLGGVFATYLGIFSADCFTERHAQDQLASSSRRKSGSSSPTMQHPQLHDNKSPFFSWFPIPRVSFKTKPARYINGFTNHATDYSHDSIPVVYHQEINRSIDNFTRPSHAHVMQHY
ncbi:putative Phospholipid phosphatase-related protein type 5 [Hypsibius exemplaris]|uniref:Phospholipid phosphatase-related protein type 5 n=1 Tax=Hypsibius exemplaris TaxID=2072580 RepID=A0A1W0WLP2_HYPEX|nr:putative Phospholipid phosphatase-related protein type 5 [Hypsibius exemplaris]